MSRVLGFFGKVLVGIITWGIIEFVSVWRLGVPEWGLKMGLAFWFKAAVFSSVFALTACVYLYLCNRQRKKIEGAWKVSPSNYEVVPESGAYRNKEKGYLCCPVCLVKDQVESVLVPDLDCLACQICGKQLWGAQ